MQVASLTPQAVGGRVVGSATVNENKLEIWRVLSRNGYCFCMRCKLRNLKLNDNTGKKWNWTKVAHIEHASIMRSIPFKEFDFKQSFFCVPILPWSDGKRKRSTSDWNFVWLNGNWGREPWDTDRLPARADPAGAWFAWERTWMWSNCFYLVRMGNLTH